MKHTQNPSSGRFCRNNSGNRPKFWDFLPFLPSPWGDFRFFVIPTSRLVNRDNEYPPFYALFGGVLIPFAVRFFIMGNRNHPQKAPYCNWLGYLHPKFDFIVWKCEPKIKSTSTIVTSRGGCLRSFFKFSRWVKKSEFLSLSNRSRKTESNSGSFRTARRPWNKEAFWCRFTQNKTKNREWGIRMAWITLFPDVY